jgi:hypothetical protein
MCLPRGDEYSTVGHHGTLYLEKGFILLANSLDMSWIVCAYSSASSSVADRMVAAMNEMGQ